MYTPSNSLGSQTDENEDIWDQIAGYDEIKQVCIFFTSNSKDIKDTIILSIKYPEKYREIARKTRKK